MDIFIFELLQNYTLPIDFVSFDRITVKNGDVTSVRSM